MKLSLGKKGDYAVRATLWLALHRGNRLKAREIASEMEIPEAYLPQVLSTLIRAGLVGSVAGPDGGYYLTRPPEEVSLLEVVEAAEGALIGKTCVLQGGPCRWQRPCVLHEHWEAAQFALVNRLDQTTFADLCCKDHLTDAPAAVPSGETS